jgi:hypothetical protein
MDINKKEGFYEIWDSKFYCSCDRQKDLRTKPSFFFIKKDLNLHDNSLIVFTDIESM